MLSFERYSFKANKEQFKMADDMFEDLDDPTPRQDGVRVDLSKIMGSGILAAMGAAFVWAVNNAMKVQDAFQNPVFMVLTFIVMMIVGGLVVYTLYSRPRERERLAMRRSLKAAVQHANRCDVELAEIKAEFSTVAKFIEGYKPSFHDTGD